MSVGFSFEEVQNLNLAQIRELAPAIARHDKTIGLNNISWARVAYHASTDDYGKIVRDLQRN